MKNLSRCLLCVALLGLAPWVSAAEIGAGLPRTEVVPAPRRVWEFSEDGILFDSQFSAARLSECTRLGADRYEVTTEPENRPINGSPWFAFRVRATAPRLISIRIRCSGAKLRYIPKVSVDGTRWITLPAEAFTAGPNEDEGTIRVDVGPEPVWVAAQEMITGDVLEAWSRSLERLPFVTRSEIGRSIGGRTLYKLDIDGTTAATKAGFVTLISRQHPPETTGSQALMRFVETLVADTPLARGFRRRYAVLLVPLVNPDGVEAGHWRHNLNGVDTNRDWGTFAQPETRAVRDAILAARERSRLMLHLDFHSTYNDVFYTQPDEKPTNPPGFTKAWLDGISRRVPAYEVKRTPNANPTQATSHHWAHREFGIPAITYELGDNTDRVLLQSVATAAAESMMELLLAEAARTASP
jgi:cytosolic carboxypeptidase protein 6